MTSAAQAGFTTRDVVYHSPGGAPLLARLYIPEGEGPFPAVVGVHGGRWCAETRLTNEPIDQALAASGVFVMALDFRMPPLVKFPLPVADINFAIRWLRAKAQEFNIRPDWIGGVGTSSGGHQILLNALLPNDERFTGDHEPAMANVDPSLRFIAACWPVTDPPGRYRYAIERDMEIHVRSHDAYWANEAQMREGSPQRIVAEGAAQSLPPLLLIQGSADVILTPHMSDHFAAAYRAAGGNVDLRHFEGEGHTFITKTPEAPASRAAIDIICAFVHQRTDAALRG